MRPRQACLGIPDCPRASFVPSESFNEAEASLPRNTGALVTGGAALTSFNEAEASLPRNTTWSSRRKNRNDSCFNEAEASLPRNTANEV